MRISWISRKADLVMPRACMVCGRRASPTEGRLCAVCTLRLPWTMFWLSPGDNMMARLFWGRIARFQKAAALFHYRPGTAASHVILRIKYGHSPGTAVLLGLLTARKLLPSGFFDGIDAIIPVPLTAGRWLRRGYNQSERIARGISMGTGIRVARHAVRRIRFTKSQTQLNAWERASNVEHAFRLHKPATLAHSHVLIVDDVVTTGSTITSVAATLAGIEGVRVSVLTVGFTQR